MLAADWSLYYLLALAARYLLGSIPLGLILTKLAGHGDLRDIGSGNIGATNVLRTGNKALAALTLLLDLLKGTAAVLIGARLGQDAAILGGLGAFLGHLFPVWLGFRGGKGVATYIGVLLGLIGRARLPSARSGFWWRSLPATHPFRPSWRAPLSPACSSLWAERASGFCS